MKTKEEDMIFPALKASIGDWVYYITSLNFNFIAKKVKLAKEIHKSETLQQMIQREITHRASEIAEYLVSEKQRFFNSLIIGIYEGDPKWYEIEIRSNKFLGEEDFPIEVSGVFGFIKLKGNEKLFALDGQHRVLGIRRAIQINKELSSEQVSAILVGHKNDEEGVQRTRRLFTTLNRYAKPVDKMEIIALDEDDVIAIITRRLYEEYDLFKEKLSLIKKRSLPPTDKRNFTLITTLYDVNNTYLKDRRDWKNFKTRRPKESVIEEYYRMSIDFWDTMVSYFQELKDMKDNPPSELIAAKYRNNKGGHLLYRPIGLKLIAEVIKEITSRQPFSVEDCIRKISQIPMQLSKKPWKGLLWDTINNRMISEKSVKKVSKQILFYKLGVDLSKVFPKTTKSKLIVELSGILNIETNMVEKEYLDDCNN